MLPFSNHECRSQLTLMRHLTNAATIHHWSTILSPKLIQSKKVALHPGIQVLTWENRNSSISYSRRNQSDRIWISAPSPPLSILPNEVASGNSESTLANQQLIQYIPSIRTIPNSPLINVEKFALSSQFRWQFPIDFQCPLYDFILFRCDSRFYHVKEHLNVYLFFHT